MSSSHGVEGGAGIIYTELETMPIKTQYTRARIGRIVIESDAA